MVPREQLSQPESCASSRSSQTFHDGEHMYDSDGTLTPEQRPSRIFPRLTPNFMKERKRPELKRWTSRVDMAEVMRTLRRGGFDLEKDSSVCRRVSGEATADGVISHESETQTHFPLGSTRSIEEVPLGAIYATVVISWNAVIMLVTEVVIEVLIVAGAYPKIPFRLSFLFLTILSGLLGAQTLVGGSVTQSRTHKIAFLIAVIAQVAVNRKEFDTSHNALQVSFLVEISLIAGDLEFLFTKGNKYFAIVPTRVPFMILTFVNVLLVSYLYIKLRLYENRTATDLPECVKPVDLGLGTMQEFRRSIVPPPPTRSDVWTLEDLGHAVVQHLVETKREEAQPPREHVVSYDVDEHNEAEEKRPVSSALQNEAIGVQTAHAAV